MATRPVVPDSYRSTLAARIERAIDPEHCNYGPSEHFSATDSQVRLLVNLPRKDWQEIIAALCGGPESEAVKLLRRCHDAGDLVTPLDETLREDVAAFFGGKDG
jgi:hypothetical protein